MFKLIKYQATNLIGFASGLSKKTFTLDLTEFIDKDIIAIVGDNASGKSTFLSTVHPATTPTDGRRQFIIKGKEGSLIRTYRSDDGTIIISKCIYSPHQEDRHNTKAYLSIQKPGDDEPIELNPNGNVTSYNSLLQTYFGITKEYLNFASYTDAVSSIVRMTDSERKSNVSTLIPNTNRFALAYNLINEKYKEYRNMIRNISQKILQIRDMESLISDLNRAKAELETARDNRDKYMKKFAEAEGRVRELSHGQDIEAILESYNKALFTIAQKESEMNTIYLRLNKLYDKLGVMVKDGSIIHDGTESANDNVLYYERMIARLDATIHTASSRVDEIGKEISQLEKDIIDAESALFGIQQDDIESLLKRKAQYESELSHMTYAKHKDDYKDMTYTEVVSFSKTVAMIDHMIQALYDEYGHIVSTEFDNSKVADTRDVENLKATIDSISSRRDAVYRQMIEKEQYKRFQDILDQRPVTCKIDTCPFIAQALKYSHVVEEIAQLKAIYNDLGVDIEAAEECLRDSEKKLDFNRDAANLINVLKLNEHLISKYLKVSIPEISQSIRNGTWSDVLDILKLKSMSAVLSEKEYYTKIVVELIPEVDHAIERARMYGSNRDIIQSQIDKLNRTLSDRRIELERCKKELRDSNEQKDEAETNLNRWREVKDLIKEFEETSSSRSELKKTSDSRKSEIDTITSLVESCREFDSEIKRNDTIVLELTPVKQQIEMDISTLMHLQEEKDQVEMDFMVIDVLRTISQPGKGIQKELINLYMYDIFQTANTLLMNTFDGKLVLKEFLITDKEFVIPYEFNGSRGSDISVASSAQQATIAMALSLAIIAKMIDKYGILTLDEVDGPMSPINKAIFVDILTKQMRLINITQAFVITHSPVNYEACGNVGFLGFTGHNLDGKSVDLIEV